MKPVNILPFMAKDIEGVIKIRVLRWGEYFGLSEMTQYNYKGLFKREAGGLESETRTWPRKENHEWYGAMIQGIQAVSRSWKRQEMDSSLEPLKGMQFCWQSSDPQNWKILNLCCFDLWVSGNLL